METEYEKYVCDKNTLKQTLEEYGVAIIPNVINEIECEEMRDGMWSFFEHISQRWSKPIDRNDVKIWRGIYDLYPLHSQLFQYWNVGHAQVSWTLRQKPKIVTIFAKLWNCKKSELLTSFDGLSMCLPPEKTNKGWQNKTWFHTDQSYQRNDLECIQSWITANDVDEGDASLAVYESSHLLHAEFANTFGIDKKEDWYKLSATDSRTIHCGSNPTKDRSVENIRQIVYLCYTPRYLCHNLIKKQEYFDTMRTCNHWPHKPKPFAKNPRTYGKELPEIEPIEPPTLTDLGMRLAGF
jgi:hypothetical protein